MKKYTLLTLAIIALLFVFTGCGDDDDDDDNGNNNYSAVQLAVWATEGVDQSFEDIADASQYANGFDPDGGFGRQAEYLGYDSTTGWWIYTDEITYMTTNYVSAESLMYLDQDANFMMYPDYTLDKYLYRAHFDMDSPDMAYTYDYNISFDGVQIDSTTTDNTIVDGSGTWDINNGTDVFVYTVIYDEVVYEYIYGELSDYPASGAFTMDMEEWAITVTFNGTSSMPMSIVDPEGHIHNFMYNAETGDVTEVTL